jgi:trk system potassium uptake protein TrkA
MKKNGKKKQITVIGLGQFGTQLALDLARHADVLAIDKSKERVEAIADHVQQARCLDASDYAALRGAIGPDFDEAIVSMGETMEASILCTLHLSKIGVKSIRAKAVNDDHASILKSVGAGYVIFPERETASRMATQLLFPNLLDYIPIEENHRVMDVAAPKAFFGQTLLALDLRRRFNIFVMAIRRLDEEKFLFLPGPDYVVRPQDTLVLIGTEAGFIKLAEAKF